MSDRGRSDPPPGPHPPAEGVEERAGASAPPPAAAVEERGRASAPPPAAAVEGRGRASAPPPARGRGPGGGRVGRRRFFRLGVAGSIALGAGGLLAWQTSGYEVPAGVARRLRHLSPKEHCVVSAVGARILRADDGAFPSHAEVETALALDGLLGALHPADRRDLLALLHVIEHAMPPWFGHVGRFTRLDGPAQDAVLEAMRTGSSGLLRAGFEGIKALVVLAYFRDARAWEAIGYDGPLVGRGA